MAAETGSAEGSSRPRRFTFSDEAPAPQSAPAPSTSSTAIPPRQGFSAATPPPSYGGFSQQPRPAAMHQPPAAAWPQQQQQQQPNWGPQGPGAWGAGGPGDGCWGGDAWAGGWGPGDAWAGWGQGAWGKGGAGGAGAFGGPPMFGTVLIGTVKSYSSVKGFGFLIHPDIPQDIWFAKETVAAELRTSDLAGTAMAFELMRAPDGKPQARNLRPAPAGAGMPPPPVNPNHHPHLMPGFRPGLPGLIRPGFPGAVRPLGVMGVGVGVPLGGPGQPKRRAWSPHAGSRAIATASMEEGQVPPPLQGLFERTEEPESHGGRKRRVPHVEGMSKLQGLEQLSTVLVRLQARLAADLRPLQGVQGEALLSQLAPLGEVHCTDPEVGAGWHISLAPLMMLRRQSIQPFEERLRKLAEGLSVPEGVQEDIWFNEGLEVFSSAEGDRYFAGVSAAAASQRWLRPLAVAVQAAARDLGMAVPSHSAELLQLHCSLAWTVGELQPALRAAGADMQESPWGRRWTLDEDPKRPRPQATTWPGTLQKESIRLRVKGLMARIGDRTTNVSFPQLAGIASERESGSDSENDED
ncbi:Usb1 [Symbiodinium natans]|uniref:U6 snRNA phosphodiesterase 1 n=1 Tax=Symbiodinium natans TaxID=878477 RepID=A0A812UW52_9DINO|nr:Usb1 [Symbiodinium natans]